MAMHAGSPSPAAIAAAGLIPRGQTDINPGTNAFQVIVALRQGGSWRIEMFQNTPAAFHGRPEVAAALMEELREAARRDAAHG